MENDQSQYDDQKPVAYDVDGKPLYAAPSSSPGATVPSQVVHVARATEPVPVEVSEETKKRHQESAKLYPWLNLSDHEYVISAVRRHSIGTWAPIAITTFATAIVFTMIFTYPEIATAYNLPGEYFGAVIVIGLLLIMAFVIGCYFAIWVYMSNRFFLTNESVIQEIQMSLFAKREQTVSLMNIEDASYTQRGPIQHVLDYGSIRLSTEGDETTYRFDYVTNPKKEIATLNNAVEAFKNGRPVEQ